MQPDARICVLPSCSGRVAAQDCARTGIKLRGKIMRRTVVIAALLATGGLSLALGDPPPASVPTASQNTPANVSTTEKSTAQSSTATPAPATAASAAPSAAAAAKANPEVSDDEKLLLSQGFKPRTIRGEKAYCKKEIPTGSTLPVWQCMSVEDAKAQAREAQEFAERMRQNHFGCLTNGKGGAICN